MKEILFPILSKRNHKQVEKKLDTITNKKNAIKFIAFFLYVRVKGLEPPSREALDPKSSVSTNFTTPALKRDQI